MPRVRHSLAVVGSAALVSGVVMSAQPSADERFIRATRARSNAAIAAHDPPAIARAWMDDIHVVSSTSVQTAGKAANQARMAAQFKNRPDTIYVRTPATVEVYLPWDVASERGEWTGRWTEPDGVMEIGGTYQAQWRKVGGQWLLQAELYVPSYCRGSKYCSQRPTVDSRKLQDFLQPCAKHSPSACRLASSA